MPNSKKTSKGGKVVAVKKTTKNSSGWEDEEVSDPEVLAEAEYAREHGEALPIPRTNDVQKPMTATNLRLHERSVSESAAVTVKANQAKAARKARGRGVSGTMSKKDKSVTCGRFTSLSEWDDCYEANFDDDEHYTSSDEECVFNEAADGEFNGEKWGRGRLGLMDNQLASVTATLDAATKASELHAVEKEANEELVKGEYDRHEVNAETVRTVSELIAENSTLSEGLMKDENVHTSSISEG